MLIGKLALACLVTAPAILALASCGGGSEPPVVQVSGGGSDGAVEQQLINLQTQINNLQQQMNALQAKVGR